MFHKPRGLIVTHDDPQNRPTLFDYVRAKFPDFRNKHLISVGRLDYNSEGLILLTNDGEIARLLEQPSSDIERVYKVRVYGRLDNAKLEKIK